VKSGRATRVLDECRAVVQAGDRLRDYLRGPATLYRLRASLVGDIASGTH
jgi:hypothetical protein